MLRSGLGALGLSLLTACSLSLRLDELDAVEPGGRAGSTGVAGASGTGGTGGGGESGASSSATGGVAGAGGGQSPGGAAGQAGFPGGAGKGGAGNGGTAQGGAGQGGGTGAGTGGGGQCTPGTAQDLGSCALCGVAKIHCSASGTWGSPVCEGQGMCTPGDTATQACPGMCASQSAKCKTDCTWGPFGACSGAGVCTAGQVDTQACGNCGTHARTCQTDCSWGAFGACTGEGACAPGQMQSTSCGNCGTATRTCDATCKWPAFGACGGEGACAPGSKQQGTCDPCSEQTCTATCGWGACALEAGNACEGKGYTNSQCCAPGAWQFCDPATCQWNPCQSCNGSCSCLAFAIPDLEKAMPRQRPPPPEAPLQRYTAKRNFAITPEPEGVPAASAPELSFVIQKHWASRLHYDFRLELDGVLLSWAVPRGPSFDPADKRMAIHVEDHPVSYGPFEGTIPPKQYGAGRVIVWDRGTWEPVEDPREGMATGKLVFRLHGEKLAGLWELVRIAKPGDKQDPWLLFKKRDAWARPVAEYDVITALPDSVVEKPLGLVEVREPRGAAALIARRPAAASVAELPGAVIAELPAKLSPQLAAVPKAFPSGGGWIYELKLDGYRLLSRLEGGRATLFTRNGHDWTARMKPLARAIEALGVKSGWLDGEIVVLDAEGVPSFGALQTAFDAAHEESITYFLFDAPYADGHDLRRVPLVARRAWLRSKVEALGHERVRFSADFNADAASLLSSAAKLGMEGIIAKRADAPYVSERASTWLKLKATARQELVVGGFIDREGSRAEVGSLLLGYYDDADVLHYAGSVGTGWDAATAAELHRKLVPLEVEDAPFAPGVVQRGRWSRRRDRTERWVKPELVAEVRFTEWTLDGSVRHPVFLGLRADKPAHSVRREASPATPAPAKRVSAVKVSNPDRVIDPTTGLKKLDLVRYYESVAQRMLPHLSGRPVSFVRGPTGITGELFFQKHDEKHTITGLRELERALWPEHPPMLEVPTVEALVSAAQMNVIEFHTWTSTVEHVDRPDRMVFDLDPGEGAPWTRVQEAALLVRTLLDELGLRSWLKTSGGKGLHVVVPLVPEHDHDAVKGFSQSVVQHLSRTVPSHFVAKSGPSNRVGRIFVDYLRNGQGATTVAAFSARARPGLGVSMPVPWEQLMSLKRGSQWTIATAREHLSFEKIDPWAELWTSPQTMSGAMSRLGYAPSR